MRRTRGHAGLQLRRQAVGGGAWGEQMEMRQYPAEI